MKLYTERSIESSTKMNVRKLSSITLGKGIAICMILLVHSAQRFNLISQFKYLFSFMQMGVQFFLILSSFALCISYHNKKPTFFQFILARIRKIYFPYVLTIALTFLLAIVSILITGKNYLLSSTLAMDIVFNILLVHGLVPTTANNLVVRGGWFIGTIMLFYLLFPLLYRLFMYGRQRIKYWNFVFTISITVICVVANILIGIFITEKWLTNNSFGYFFIINQMPCLALGFVLYDIYICSKKHNTIVGLLCAIFSLIGAFFLFHSDSKIAFVLLPVMCGFAFMLFMICLMNHDHKLEQGIFVNAIKKLGEQSFGIYLTHTFIVYEGSMIIRKAVRFLDIGISETLLYFICLPIMIITSYYAGKIFLVIAYKLQHFIEMIIIKKRKTERTKT